MCQIDFLGTTKFHNTYPSPSRELDKYREYLRDKIWDEISGNHVFKKWPDVIVDIPQNPSFIGTKVDYEDSWLQNNWSEYANSDCTVVLDYWGEGGSVGAASSIGYAGDDQFITCTVDLGWFSLPSYYDGDIKDHHKLVGHEVGHIFGAYHQDSGISNDNEASVMISDADPSNCRNYGTAEAVKHSYCDDAETEIERLTGACGSR